MLPFLLTLTLMTNDSSMNKVKPVHLVYTVYYVHLKKRLDTTQVRFVMKISALHFTASTYFTRIISSNHLHG